MKGKVFLVVLLLGLLACATALAAETTGFIGFVSEDQTQAYWGYPTETTYGADAVIRGDGLYSVGLSFTSPVKQVSFSQIMIPNGEKLWPGSTIEVLAVSINGKDVPFKKGYTGTNEPNGADTVMSLWDPWFEGFNNDYRPRSFDGVLSESFVLDKSDFTGAKTIGVTFYFHAKESKAASGNVAYIGIRDKSDSLYYWGEDSAVSSGVTANVTGDGQYTVSVSFVTPIQDVYFADLIINNAEERWPDGTIQITSVTINGRKINFKKGFTFSSNHVDTHISLWDPWFSGHNADYHPRSFDGSIRGTTRVLSRTDLVGAKNIEISFYYSTNR